MHEKRIQARREAEEIVELIREFSETLDISDKLFFFKILATGLKPMLEENKFSVLPEDDVCAFYYRLKRLKTYVQVPGEDELTT